MLSTKVTEILGIEVPIFAFSHCRDVVLAASKTGGMGVLGAAWMTPEELEISLRWIEERIDGRPYAVDLVFPGSYASLEGQADFENMLPPQHRGFVQNLLDDGGVPRLPENDAKEYLAEFASKRQMTPEQSQRLLEIVLRHNVKLVVGAMGAPPKELVERLHGLGIKVGALVGSARHVKKQCELGVDVLVAQGAEAGGHVGSVASMVLWPQVIEAAGSIPVLAAGGISRGSQFAAAMAMGAAGVWCGSIWLGTKESEFSDAMRKKLFEAQSEDAVVSRALTGKPCRMLRSRYTEAWDRPDAPEKLKFPLQSILGGEPLLRAERANRLEYWTYAIGQVVGDMNEETDVRSVFHDLLNGYAESMDRLNSLMED